MDRLKMLLSAEKINHSERRFESEDGPLKQRDECFVSCSELRVSFLLNIDVYTTIP